MPSSVDYKAEGEEYRNVGITRLTNLLSEEVLAECKKCYDWSYANPSAIGQTYWDDNFYNDGQCKGSSGVYRELMEKHGRLFGKTCQDLWGLGADGNVWFFYAELFHKRGGAVAKPGRGSGVSPFHQDTTYIPFSGPQIAQIWFNFEEYTPKRNAVHVVPFTHKGVTYNGSKTFSPGIANLDVDLTDAEDDTPLFDSPEQLLKMPKIPKINYDKPEEFDLRSYDLRRGDALCFHPGCLHGGAPVTPEFPERHTLVLRFFGDQMRFTPIPVNDHEYARRFVNSGGSNYKGMKTNDPFVFSKSGQWMRLCGPGLPGLKDIPLFADDLPDPTKTAPVAAKL